MDIESLLKSLNAHDARYVIIGAMAFPVHGYSRSTLDLDVMIEPTPENAARVRKALFDFGYDLTDVSVEDLLKYKVLIRQSVVECDIHPFVAGAMFHHVWTRRVEEKFGETPTAFASLDDLISMKRAAGREKDLRDLAVLERLRDTPPPPAPA